MSSKAVRFAACITFLSVGITSWRVYALMCTIDRFELEYDGPLSEAGFNAIEAFLLQHSHESLTKINQNLFEQFPFINSVTLQRLPNRLVHVNIIIPEPSAQLNDRFFLLTSGKRCAAKFIQHRTSLPKIDAPEAIMETTIYDQAIMQFVRQAPDELFDTYQCEFHAPSYIKLIAHNQSHKILCLPTIEKRTLNLCQQLIHEQEQNNKKTKKWIGDIRFKNQIILQKEGGGHGAYS